MADALILTGGVAKGAFGAGVLSVLLGTQGKSKAQVDVHSIVATSSGGLNGAFAASVLHAGTEVEKIGQLPELWLEEATFGRVFEPTLHGILGLRGVSAEDRVMDIMRGAITPAPKVRTIELRLVVANLAGHTEQVGGAPATTYETVLPFGAATFESADRLEDMFRAVTASSAFPGAFLPVPLTVDGKEVVCIDGGAVNNAPLSYALDHPFEMERVFVVSPTPRVPAEARSEERGIAFVMHLAEILIEERLFRDLRTAYAMNDSLARLDGIVTDPAVRAQVLDAISWTGRKPIQIVELRPPNDLPGEMFDGLFSRQLRKEYIESGEAVARAWIAGLP